MASGETALLTDLYELTMLQGYFREAMNGTAVFELFVRRLPQTRGFLLVAGIEQAASYLENLGISENDRDYLASVGGFRADYLDWLSDLRFTGDVDAMPEGTIVFENEPLIRVIAPLPAAQLVETRVMNIVHLQTIIASKAARARLVAQGKQLVDFGLRRAHGAEAGLAAARAAYVAGFDGTSTVEAGRQFGIPLFGTMAHSYVQAHGDEAQAFLSFARANPRSPVFLIDTYDCVRAAETVVELAPRLQNEGISIHGVRIDSGDLGALARQVRGVLDGGGLRYVKILVSGSLDEFEVEKLVSQGAPIDGFGLGSRIGTAVDAPYLDCAYKLTEYEGRPMRKVSEGKATWPGRKLVSRTTDAHGLMQEDTVTIEGAPFRGTSLLQPVTRKGRRVSPPEPLDLVRQRAMRGLEQLPSYLRGLAVTTRYPVCISQDLQALARQFDEARDLMRTAAVARH